MNAVSMMTGRPYRGRLAPSPTGLLHVGHACTFWTAYQRAIANHGSLIFRNEDLDPQRSKAEFASAMMEDLRWLGTCWQEGPEEGGPFAPYVQSQRRDVYLAAWQKLRDGGFIYPCTCSRKDLAHAAAAPNDVDDEPIYPGRCREKVGEAGSHKTPQGVNWRFLVPDGETISFDDLRQGRQNYVAGGDFGDFVIWRRDDVPAYQLAVVADDGAMQITEIVRGADLLKSTARQLLLIRALQLPVPSYFHCDLVRDRNGERLAKRHDALSLRALREQGHTPQGVLNMCAQRNPIA
ncbi:MAG TPA: tRNA glutamyl-Q(34) synthetase GluQRS [Terriglobales bacterium]|jgi:glutamyl-tRNA synthetase|nr:tRNA glutamyl-Q(34) synthetase GluQRS [Terriglobales bacterium]